MITEEQRKENAKSMISYLSAVAGIFGGYVGAQAGGIMLERGVDFLDTFGIMADSITNLQFLPPFNAMSLIGAVAGSGSIAAASYFFLKTDNERNYSYKLDEVAGTGGFMNEKQKKEFLAQFEKDPEKPGEPSPNMILGQTARRPNNSRLMIGNNNIAVIGGAGTGKSRFVIKPNLLTLNSSFVITDPSGEIINSLGKVLNDHGYKIKIFNISDMEHSNCYNPFDYIRDDAGVRMVVECFINNTSNKEGGGEEFWVNAEKLLYSAIIFYLRDYEQDYSKKNFSTLVNMVNMATVDEDNPNSQSELDKIFEKIDQNSLAAQYYRGFKKGAGKTLKSIVISCIARLQPFMTPQVQHLTQMDQMELDKLGDRKTALFIITPQADRTYSFLASMLYSQMFETLYYKGEKQKAEGGSEQLEIPVRCLMDEFANIGEIPEFPSKLSTMRKYNISATVILQDISQIESMYKDDWKTLMGNCSTYIFLGTQEPNTLKYFSELLGKMTVTNRSRGTSSGSKSGSNKNFQQTSREVMTPDELGRMDPMMEVVFMQNQRPIMDRKYRYEKHPLYEYTGDASDDNLFLYQSMSEFNTSQAKVFSCTLKAFSEILKYHKTQEVTKSQNTDSVVIQISQNEAFDKIVLDREERASILNQTITKLSSELIKTKEHCPVIVLKSVQTAILMEAAEAVAIQTGKMPFVLFSDMGSDILNGVFYGSKEDFKLYDFGMFKKVEKHNNRIRILFLKKNALELYKETIQEQKYE